MGTFHQQIGRHHVGVMWEVADEAIGWSAVIYEGGAMVATKEGRLLGNAGSDSGTEAAIRQAVQIAVLSLRDEPEPVVSYTDFDKDD